jgi:hypothetical protein
MQFDENFDEKFDENSTAIGDKCRSKSLKVV